MNKHRNNWKWKFESDQNRSKNKKHKILLNKWRAQTKRFISCFCKIRNDCYFSSQNNLTEFLIKIKNFK